MSCGASFALGGKSEAVHGGARFALNIVLIIAINALASGVENIAYSALTTHLRTCLGAVKAVCVFAIDANSLL